MPSEESGARVEDDTEGQHQHYLVTLGIATDVVEAADD